jgi:raffinose/stachyose/melibiose transport system substrate-binding protein
MTVEGAAELEKRQERQARLRNYLGLAILLAALGWSVVHVTIHSFGSESDTALLAGKKVIRFAHWQLEGRCVEALNEACREYERLHPDVAVQQIEIPERAYEQWTRTQLIGRTAPDLIETRWWPNLLVRYFVPLGEYVEQPNPYNDDDPCAADLKGLPWRETYIDNMLGGWNDNLRGYYGMPVSLFTVRCFANKDLIREAAGVTEPPKDLGEFFEICERIEAYARRRKKSDPSFRLVPIAGSDYTENMFRGRYWGMATWDLVEDYDTNLDCWLGDDERVEAILTGRLNLATDPRIRAGHQVLYDISRYFNPGFMAARRDESVFLFSQGNAAMIATGTWDAGSLWRQIAGDFEIMVFDFPIPAPDQEYGRYIRHRITEAGQRAGFSFGLTRISTNKKIAIDFMRFLTSRRINEKINRAFRWFPAIRGARTDEILRPFRPRVEGIFRVIDIWFRGGDTHLRYDQKYKRYISARDPQPKDYTEFLAAAAGDREDFVKRFGNLARSFLADFGSDPAEHRRCAFAEYRRRWRDWHYDEFIRAFAADYQELALADFRRTDVDTYHQVVQVEAALAQTRAAAMREGLTGRIRRTYVSRTLGQTSRIDAHVRQGTVYRRLKALEAQPKGDGP